VVRAAEPYRPGINQPEGPKDALNKWSRKITQPKSQGASQARPSPLPPAAYLKRCDDAAPSGGRRPRPLLTLPWSHPSKHSGIL